MKRSSGILMHISSLPGKYGIGTFGKEAYEFVDFLKKSGQSYWQILPLGQTSYGDSPYQCFSAFAGNPYFVDFDILEKEGFLSKEEYENEDFGGNDKSIEYGTLFVSRMKVLRRAYENSKGKLVTEIENFKKEQELWLEDYSLYMAIKNDHNLESWQNWEESIKLREENALNEYKVKLKDEIEFWTFVQYMFFKQWSALKKYANDNGIKIIGDIPIYVSEDSADIWSNPKYFKVDEKMIPTKVAGCPPDAFAVTGQLWGNPIYDWNELEKDGFSWWIDRVRESLKIYDVVRIDHFRGFESYWEIPYGDETAINGKWVKGPGIKLFEAIENALGKVDIIAEDLGFLTDEVKEFLKATGFPGMKILQFAFGDDDSSYIPYNYPRNCIAYTGTHDNNTFRGWFETMTTEEERKNCVKYLGLNEEEGYGWGFIRGVWESVANLSIATMQDFLDLGNEARMNEPSTLGKNWKWRATKDQLSDELADKIYDLTKTFGRI